jgi:hypothetical protein
MDERLEAKYRMLFLSPTGQEVLSDILVNFCYLGQYHESGSQEQDGAYNVGLKILGRMGIVKPGNGDTLVRAMLGAVPGARLIMPLDPDEEKGDAGT